MYRLEIGSLNVVKRSGEIGLNPSGYSELTAKEAAQVINDIGKDKITKVFRITKIDEKFEEPMHEMHIDNEILGVD
jgi:hypothetical protein